MSYDGLQALTDAVRAETERYADRNPLSAASGTSGRSKSMPGGNTRSILHFDPFPLAFERGDGAYLGRWTATSTPTSSASSPPGCTATRRRRSSTRCATRSTAGSTSAASTSSSRGWPS